MCNVLIAHIIVDISPPAQLLTISMDRESKASQCMDIHRNPRTSKWISIKAWIIEDWYPWKHEYPFMNVLLRISIAECPCMDIPAWILMWISTLVWVIEDWHQKIMDIHVDIRGFLGIHVWICYGFSYQGWDLARREVSHTSQICQIRQGSYFI